MTFALKRYLTGGLLGALCLMAVPKPAKAAETIRFQYQQIAITIDLKELSTLAEQGDLSTPLQKIFGEKFQVPPFVQGLLTKEITIPASANQLLEGSAGNFLMEKLDTFVGNESYVTSDNIKALTAAFDAALKDDGKISFLELARRYPEKEVNVNLTDLEGTVKKITGFIERMRPTLGFAQLMLQSQLCNCSAATLPDAGVQVATQSENILAQKNSEIDCSPAHNTLSSSELESLTPASKAEADLEQLSQALLVFSQLNE